MIGLPHLTSRFFSTSTDTMFAWPLLVEPGATSPESSVSGDSNRLVADGRVPPLPFTWIVLWWIVAGAVQPRTGRRPVVAAGPDFLLEPEEPVVVDLAVVAVPQLAEPTQLWNVFPRITEWFIFIEMTSGSDRQSSYRLNSTTCCPSVSCSVEIPIRFVSWSFSSNGFTHLLNSSP
jgi:hypothetical protein